MITKNLTYKEILDNLSLTDDDYFLYNNKKYYSLHIVFLEKINRNLLKESIEKIVESGREVEMILNRLDKTDFTKEVFCLEIFANKKVPILRRKRTIKQFNEDTYIKLYCTGNDFIKYCLLTY